MKDGTDVAFAVHSGAIAYKNWQKWNSLIFSGNEVAFILVDWIKHDQPLLINKYSNCSKMCVLMFMCLALIKVKASSKNL